MNKFKVGDIVTFDYDDKSGEGKIVEVPNDHFERYVVELLGDLRGTGHNSSCRCGSKYHGNNCWNVPERFMQLVKREEIHITRHGNTVHAVMKDGNKVVKRSKAVCSKEDTFDFETGAKLAVDRLFDGIDNLKPGDYIKLKDCFDGLGNCATGMRVWAGKVVTVDSMPRQSEQPGSKFYIKIKEDGGNWNWNDWFIEKKTTEAPKKDPDDLTGKYAIITSCGCFHEFDTGDTCQIDIDDRTDAPRLKRLRDGKKSWQNKEHFEILETENRYADDDEYVLITMSNNLDFNVGDILRIREGETDWSYARAYNGKLVCNCKYLVLKDYEPLEVYPGLVCTDSRKYYGKIGTPTSMEDIRGEQLFIGDVVTLVNKRGVNHGKEFVCEDEGDQFVMGIRCDCHANGKIDGWTVIKEKSYEDVEHDERYGAVAAKMYD